MMAPRKRRRADWYKAVRASERVVAAGPPPSPWMGHNQGPPLEGSRTWADHCWRRSQRAAWRRAPLEVVRRRVGRARKLGLAYERYVLVILERGVNLQAAIFGFAGTLVRGALARADIDSRGRVTPLAGVMAKLSRLTECLVFVAAHLAGREDARTLVGQVDAGAGAVIDEVAVSADPPDRADGGSAVTSGMLGDLVRRRGLAPSAAFLVGAWIAERRAASDAGLGLFVPAADYFNDANRS